jgi:hypothetical protein
MIKNPYMKILVMEGYYDLATPFAAPTGPWITSTWTPQFRQNVSYATYNSGHMVYIDRAEHNKMKKTWWTSWRSACRSSSAVACDPLGTPYSERTMLNASGNAKPMRAAVILGLGTSPADLKPFQSGSPTQWLEGLPVSSSDADAILIFGGDGTIHRHLPALVRLHLPVLIVPAGSGNDFARALKLHSVRDSLRVWRDFEVGKHSAAGNRSRGNRPVRFAGAHSLFLLRRWVRPGFRRRSPRQSECRAGCGDTAAMPWLCCRCCSSLPASSCG